MSTASPRLAPWLFGGSFLGAVALVAILSASALTSAVSAALLVQLALGGEMPREAVAGAVCLAIALVFGVLAVYFLVTALS